MRTGSSSIVLAVAAAIVVPFGCGGSDDNGSGGAGGSASTGGSGPGGEASEGSELRA